MSCLLYESGPGTSLVKEDGVIISCNKGKAGKRQNQAHQGQIYLRGQRGVVTQAEPHDSSNSHFGSEV